MAERIVDRVRKWLRQGRTRLEAFQELREQGYGETVAERIVEEAASRGGGMGTRKLLVVTAVILLVIGGGATFAVLTLLPADGGSDSPPVSDGRDGDDPPALTALVDRTDRSTYDVTYAVEAGNVSPIIDITAVRAYRSGGVARTDVTVTLDGTVHTFSAYDPVETSQIILCGDMGLDEDTCTTDHPYLFVAALILTDLLPLEPVLDDMSTVYQGNETVRGRQCDRFQLNTTTDQLYANVINQVTGDPPRLTPVRLNACLDMDKGYVAALTMEDASRPGGSTLSMTATTVNTTTTPGAFTPPLPIALAANCGVANATATLVALHPDIATATLMVSGTNRTVPLSSRYRPVRIPLGTLSPDTTTLTAYAAGQSASTPCRP